MPGGPERRTRKQLLDQVDGVVLVIDSDPARLDENAAMVDELRKGLAEYARRLDDLPLVVQYNKRDLTDDYGVDELHRRLGLGGATVFESVATDGAACSRRLDHLEEGVRSLRARASAGSRLTPAAAPPLRRAARRPRPRRAPALPVSLPHRSGSRAPRAAVAATALAFEHAISRARAHTARR